MAEKRGVKRPELIQPVIPMQVKYLWRWYCDLKRSFSPLSWAEIKAWAELTRRNPNEWEIATLRAIDTEITR